jgi:hypothetical protein
MQEFVEKLVGFASAAATQLRVPQEVELRRGYDQSFRVRNDVVPTAEAMTEDPAIAVVHVAEFVTWMFSRETVIKCLRSYLTVCRTTFGIARPRVPLSWWWDATVGSERCVFLSFLCFTARWV